jgi:hypothetical protein
MANDPIPRHVAAMRIIVSLSILTAGIGILTAPNWLFPAAFDEGMQKIAAGWVGAVIGYWLA